MEYLSYLQRETIERNSRTEAQRKAKVEKDLREQRARLKHSLRTMGPRRPQVAL